MFEPRFGLDLGRTRVHTDDRAARAARSIQAQAFTLGQDIVFARGRYNPGTPQGDRLLAHELTHVVHHGAERRIHRQIEVNPGLDLDTMGYAATKSGNIYTAPQVLRDIGLYNEVVTGLLGSPRIFKLKGNSDAEVSRNFKKHIKARLEILEFARNKQYRFAAGTAVTMNPAYWSVSSQDDYEVKEGVDREEAIADLNEHPQEYAISCFMASELTMQSGGRSPAVMTFGAAQDDWVPADWGYIENTKYGGSPGLEGENIIYAGTHQFWGHFGSENAYKTLQEWFDLVESWNGGADIQTHRYVPFDELE